MRCGLKSIVSAPPYRPVPPSSRVGQASHLDMLKLYSIPTKYSSSPPWENLLLQSVITEIFSLNQHYKRKRYYILSTGLSSIWGRFWQSLFNSEQRREYHSVSISYTSTYASIKMALFSSLPYSTVMGITCTVKCGTALKTITGTQNIVCPTPLSYPTLFIS